MRLHGASGTARQVIGMDKSFEIAVAGAGITGRWHAAYARRCGARVCAIVDPDESAGRRLAARIAGAAWCTDVADLLQRSKPAVLHVCSPLKTHAGIARLALEAGAHVLIEKPLAESAATTEALLELASRQGLLLVPVHQFVFQDGMSKALAVLPGLGRMLHLEARICSAGGTGFPAAGLDQIAADILPHPLSLVERLMPGLSGSADWKVLRPDSGEWRAVAGGGGMSIDLLVSLHGRPTECSFQVTAEQGSIHLDLFHGFARIDRGSVSRAGKITQPFRTASAHLAQASLNLARRLVHREPAYPGLLRLIRLFYEAVRTGSGAPLQPAEILAVAQVRDSLLRSGGGP